MSWGRTDPLKFAEQRRIDRLLQEPCQCEQLPHACDRCKELAQLFDTPRSARPVSISPLPTVGRLVLVRHPSLRMGSIEAPAVIVEVHSDTRVAVTAFGLFGAMVWIQSVEYAERMRRPDGGPVSEGWCWLPHEWQP